MKKQVIPPTPPQKRAGHPRISGDGTLLVRFSVMLTAQQKAALDALPPGTASATVREALRAFGIGEGTTR